MDKDPATCFGQTSIVGGSCHHILDPHFLGGTENIQQLLQETSCTRRAKSAFYCRCNNSSWWCLGGQETLTTELDFRPWTIFQSRGAAWARLVTQLCSSVHLSVCLSVCLAVLAKLLFFTPKMFWTLHNADHVRHNATNVQLLSSQDFEMEEQTQTWDTVLAPGIWLIFCSYSEGNLWLSWNKAQRVFDILQSIYFFCLVLCWDVWGQFFCLATETTSPGMSKVSFARELLLVVQCPVETEYFNLAAWTNGSFSTLLKRSAVKLSASSRMWGEWNNLAEEVFFRIACPHVRCQVQAHHALVCGRHRKKPSK